jgi:hypothetical protein
MRRFIFDAGGTGFSREAAGSLLSEPEADQYIQGLGDEIMLLEGLEYPVGYDTGPAGAFSPPWNGSTDYDFGVDGFSLKGFQLGAGTLSQNNQYKYVGLDRRLGGLAGNECQVGSAIQQSICAAGPAGCAAISDPGARNACTQSLNLVCGISGGAISAACQTPGGPTPAQQEAIDAQIRRLEEIEARYNLERQGGQQQQGLSTTTMVVGGIAVVGVLGLLAVVALRR